MYSFVARLAVNLCRIMSEVAVLRALESPQPYDFKTSPTSPFTPDKEIPADNRKDDIITRWDVSISQEDFHAVLSLAEPLYCHATHILSFLPVQKSAIVLMPIVIISSRNWVMNLLVHSYWKKQLPWELRKTQPSLG